MSHYEITYVISAAIPENDYPGIEQRIKDLIVKEHSGTVTSQMTIGRRKLAYPIKKEKFGFYQTLEFDMEPEMMKMFDRELKLNQSLLRHLIIIKDVLSAEQQAREESIQAKVRARKAAAKTHHEETTHEPIAEEKKRPAPAKITLDKLDERLDELLDQELK